MQRNILRGALGGALLLLLAPVGAVAFQLGPGTYRVDWHQAAFETPMYLVQCTGVCSGDGLALVANPGSFPAGSLRVLGGPYRHGAELTRDRDRLLAAGLPARPLHVDVRDDRGQPLDGVLLADPDELRRLAATFTRRAAGPPMAPQRPAESPYQPQAAPAWRSPPPVYQQAPGQTSSQGLTSPQLQSLNERGRALEAELQRLNRLVEEANRLLQAVDSGSILINSYGTLVPVSRNALYIYTLANAQAESYGARHGLGPDEITTDDAIRATEQLVRESVRYAAGLRLARQQYLARRDEILRELDQIRRTVLADAERPAPADDPAEPTPAATDGESWSGQYDRVRVRVVDECWAPRGAPTPQPCPMVRATSRTYYLNGRQVHSERTPTLESLRANGLTIRGWSIVSCDPNCWGRMR